MWLESAWANLKHVFVKEKGCCFTIWSCCCFSVDNLTLCVPVHLHKPAGNSALFLWLWFYTLREAQLVLHPPAELAFSAIILHMDTGNFFRGWVEVELSWASSSWWGRAEKMKTNCSAVFPQPMHLLSNATVIFVCAWSQGPNFMALHAAEAVGLMLLVCSDVEHSFSLAAWLAGMSQSFGVLSSLGAVLKCFFRTIVLQWGFIKSEDFLWHKACPSRGTDFTWAGVEYELFLHAFKSTKSRNQGK